MQIDHQNFHFSFFYFETTLQQGNETFPSNIESCYSRVPNSIIQQSENSYMYMYIEQHRQMKTHS